MMNYNTTNEIRQAVRSGELSIRAGVRLIRQLNTCARIKREVMQQAVAA
jgi:hypothetical protein